MLREIKTNPHRLIGCDFVSDTDTIVIKTEKGITETIDVAQLRCVDRYNNGKFFIDCEEAGNVVTMWVER
jgi:topoisomerase-4 subunit A